MRALPVDPAAAPDSPQERLAANLMRLTRGLFKLSREDARELGISAPKVFLLHGLSEEGAVPASRWVERTGATPPAMSALLDGLEEEGFITRAHDPKDRRQVLIALTPKGRRVAEKLKEKFRLRWRGLCSGIADSRLESAAITMGRIAERLDDIDDPAPVGPSAGTVRRGGS